MEIQYVHVKTRSQFGKQCIFDDEGPTVIENIPPDRELMEDYIYRNPCHMGVEKSTQFAVHEVQTTSAATKESGMSHVEGGWPKELNPKDDEAVARYRRRVEKDDNWPLRMKNLMEPMEHCVLQNNAVNIYDIFFDDMVTSDLVLPLDARTVNVYEDPERVVRPITHLSWSPDHGKRLAVSYCWLELERKPGGLNPWSYIWDIENPNKAFMALKASCPSVTIEFNPRDPSILISGLLSGQVCNWDIRTGDTPVQMSHLQFSHRNPANQALWINSKSNTEFFSASTGGAIKWWDMRKLREPTETLVMDLENPTRGDVVRAIGVSSLEYEPTMGTKFMAGMENGIVVSGTRKGKNAQEKLALRFVCHDGPVVSIGRNPFGSKNFLTVGPRVAKIWAEDTREGNLVSTNQHSTVALTAGCWSTSRYSLFYVITGNGTMEAYDVLVGIKSPVKSIRLCENALKSIAPHEDGRLVAVGCSRGRVYLVESSDGLTTNTRNDKALMTAYFDRCSRYEKAVDNRLKEVRLAQKTIESDEQIEELPAPSPAYPTKGKSKGVGKDARVKDIINDKKAEDKASRGAAPGGIEDRDKKSKIKIKKVKDTLVSSSDPELADAQRRYYELIHKEMEKYTEIAALDDVSEAASAAAASSSLSRMGETSSGARRRKHEDSKADKEASGARRGLGRDDMNRRKQQQQQRGKSGGGEKVAKTDDIGTEEIVIMRKSRHGDTRLGAQVVETEVESRKTSEKMDEHARLESITEENDEKIKVAEKKKAMRSERAVKKVMKSTRPGGVEGRDKGMTRGKDTILEMEKPCSDYVCQPDVCCLDKTAPQSERKTRKLRSSDEKIDSSIDSESEMRIKIEDMLASLPKSVLPSQLAAQLADEETMGKKSMNDESSEEKDVDIPILLEEKAEVARREAREYQESSSRRKPRIPMKLQRREEMKSVLTTRDILDVSHQVSRSFERFSINDEASLPSGELVNHAVRTAAKEPRDCDEPIALKFGAREIRETIGVPDAPTPRNQPRNQPSESRISKSKDYPRISAAAIPKLETNDH